MGFYIFNTSMHTHIFRKILILGLLFPGLYLQAQITLSGKAIEDQTDLPVEAATVYLTYVKDSAVVEYSLTGAEGDFKIALKKIEEPVLFRISDDYAGDFEQEFDKLTEDVDLGEVRLRQIIDLEGVVISGAPPIRVKNDTIEFNASSFKVRPDANVEALLRQLPGVDIDEEGTVTVNGKEVNKILVNGKSFFDNDGKIAMENLPANLINKVQVTDTKTKKEELAGDRASGNQATINLTIDEDKNKGFMLKLLGGYGTDERYESSFLFNYFKKKSRLSILGASNNINAVGFSMDEIFDSMGSMRTTSVSTRSGGMTINGMSFGAAGSGITTSNLGGISYSDDFTDDLEFSGNYFYTQADTKNTNRTRREELLPDHVYTTESLSKTKNKSESHNFNSEIQVKLDSTSTLWFAPKYTYSKVRALNEFEKFSVNEEGEMLNESFGETDNERQSQTFDTNINFFKTFADKSKLSLDVSNSNKVDNMDDKNISATLFYQTPEPDDIRNQISEKRNKNGRYTVGAEYEIALNDSLGFGIGANYEYNKITQLKNTFDFNEASGQYSLENDLLSTDIGSDFNRASAHLMLQIRKKRLSFRVGAGVQYLEQDNRGHYLSQDYKLRKTKTAPKLNLYANYRFGRSSSLYLNYSYDVNMPTALQLLAIEDLSNPLSISSGNPDLKPTERHNMYMGYNNFNFQAKTGVNMYVGFDYSESDVVAFRMIDENFVTHSTYENLDGNYGLWASLNAYKSFKSGNSNFRVGFGFSGSHRQTKGFVDAVKFTAKNYSFRPRINFNWDLGQLLTVNPSYSISWQHTDYTNYRVKESNNLSQIFKISVTNYWPKRFVFGNDFSYTYNSDIADGFKKDFLLWNTSLSYNFWQDKLSFKVKVYDVLGQNTGTSRSISGTVISDSQNDVLKRYVMFSLGYKLDKFGGKSDRRRGRRVFFD